MRPAASASEDLFSGAIVLWWEAWAREICVMPEIGGFFFPHPGNPGNPVKK
jgi:hypothetical protein